MRVFDEVSLVIIIGRIVDVDLFREDCLGGQWVTCFLGKFFFLGLLVLEEVVNVVEVWIVWYKLFCFFLFRVNYLLIEFIYLSYRFDFIDKDLSNNGRGF